MPRRVVPFHLAHYACFLFASLSMTPSRLFAGCPALLLSLLVGGCNKPPVVTPTNLISQNDFDSLNGWVPMPPSVTDEQAHSGRFSTKVDGGTEFGLGYGNTMAEAGLQAGQKLTLSAWALRTGGGSTASLVVQVINPADPTQQVFWEGFPIEKQVLTYNRWMQVSLTVTLPASCIPAHQFKGLLVEQPEHSANLSGRYDACSGVEGSFLLA